MVHLKGRGMLLGESFVVGQAEQTGMTQFLKKEANEQQAFFI
tara:strand:- start:1219 stop:1344 length:126 start_codon:yes stop_codon:yes gene_type:complete